MKRSKACDKTLQKIDPHLHGGYECGDDGLWTEKCIGSYCDYGYEYYWKKQM